MAQKTIRSMILEAQALGYSITYRNRTDGGVIITSINGKHYRGAKGNTALKNMLGYETSKARAIQLERINKKVASGKLNRRRVKPLPEDLLKKLEKVQRKWRKHHEDIEGTITRANVRWVYEHYGKEAALHSLDQASRYAKGLAYDKHIEWFLLRLKSNLDKCFIQEWSEVYDLVSRLSPIIKADHVYELTNLLYDWEKTTGDLRAIGVEKGRKALALLKAAYLEKKAK